MFDPAAASVVANTMILPAGMPSAIQQSANVKVSVPVLPTRPTPTPGNYLQTVVVSKDVVIGGKVVLEAGKVLTKPDLDKVVAAYGSDNIGTVPVPVGGLIIVISTHKDVPSTEVKQGDIVDQARLNELVTKYGDLAVKAEKVEPVFVVGPAGIVPKKPESVVGVSPTKP